VIATNVPKSTIADATTKSTSKMLYHKGMQHPLARSGTLICQLDAFKFQNHIAKKTPEAPPANAMTRRPEMARATPLMIPE